MGQSCKQVQKQETAPSTYQLSQLQNFGNLTFTFTSDKINRISCDCLIVFTDSKMQLNRNQFLLKCGHKTADRIQDYFNATKQNAVVEEGQSLIVDVSNEQFGFHKICIVILKVCEGNSFHSKNNPLQVYTETALKMVKQSKWKSLMFLQINSQFGLPNQVSFGIILDAINNYKASFDDIGFVCVNEASMGKAKISVENYGKNKDKSNEQEMGKTNKTFSKVSNTNSKASEYY